MNALTQTVAAPTFETSDLPAALQDKPKLDAMVGRVRALAEAHIAQNLDMGTEPARAATRSLAAKIASSKAAVEKAKLGLTEEWRRQTADVNGLAKTAVAELQALQDQVRAPLTAWEEAERDRKAALYDRMRTLDASQTLSLSAEMIRAEIARIEGVAIDDTWQEAKAAAETAKADALADLGVRLDLAVKREAEQAELEQLRREKAEREAADAAAAAETAAENRRIAKEKADKERADREAREREEAAQWAAEAAKARAEAEAEEKIAAAERASQAAAQAAREAEEREKAANAAAVAAAEQAEKDAAAREERARADEQERAASELREKEAAETKRAADKRLRAKAKAAMVDDLLPFMGKGGGDEAVRHNAEQVAEAIMAGKLRNVAWRP